ncbi:MAG: hypothetical protein KDB53_12285, partial [Planctomycetes bacterium]|nr:hypothetical protein [Planctomycetota bacterium]
QSVVYRYVQDPKQITEQLTRGDLDFAVLPDVTSRDTTRSRAEEAGLETAHYNLSRWVFLGWNLKKKPFDDLRVRRALSYLIPRERICEIYFGGDARPATGPFDGCDPALSDPTVEVPMLSPRKARELLTEAGFSDSDGDGRLDRDGKPFRFDLRMTTESAPFLGGAVEQIRESFSQAGIEMRIDTGSSRELLALDGGALASGDFEAYALAWMVEPVLPDVRQLYGTGGTWNWQGYSNPQVDAALLAYETATNDVVRVQSAQRIHGLLHADQPMAWVLVPPVWIAWNKRIHGVEPHALGVRQWDFWIDSK